MLKETMKLIKYIKDNTMNLFGFDKHIAINSREESFIIQITFYPVEKDKSSLMYSKEISYSEIENVISEEAILHVFRRNVNREINNEV